MKTLVALGVSVVLSAELAALSLHDRRFVLWVAGGGVAAQVVVPNSDADPPVGVDPSRLGPASAPNAGAAVRDRDGAQTVQRPGSG